MYIQIYSESYGLSRDQSILLCKSIYLYSLKYALREEFSQTNGILQYKLLAAILSAVCSVIQ